MRCLLASSFTLVLLGGCATTSPLRVECVAHGGPRWHKVDSAKVRVQSNLAPERLQTEVTRLEQLLQGMKWALDDNGPFEQVDLVLVHQGDLAALGHDVVGLVRHDGSARQVLIEAGDPEDPRSYAVAAHELAHVVIDRTMPGAPRWLHEGLASYLDVAELQGQLKMKTGTGHFGYQGLVNDGLSRAKDLWAWGTRAEPSGESLHRRTGARGRSCTTSSTTTATASTASCARCAKAAT
ncbi:MAG: hypothetical protein JNK82_12585 [Myxococcaceae bacterium]|nr:hypothetical protein [Myxococcaceae bacterium]